MAGPAGDWDAQMLFFIAKGFRVVAHDRRDHARSNQVSDGHDMDHYASDAAAVAEHLNLRRDRRRNHGLRSFSSRRMLFTRAVLTFWQSRSS
jgi:pimeloyl-ACP methyl ester carboxylesterase